MSKEKTVFSLPGGRSLVRGELPLVMGVINVTPDSFSDGGQCLSCDAAAERALKMLDSGADIIDIGGESTRPGSGDPGREEEAARVIPVIEGLAAARPGVIISVDTRKSSVAELAVRSGASIINDVSGLRFSPDMAEIAARSGAALVIMQSRGTPADMQSPENLVYGDIFREISDFLMAAAEKAVAAGVRREAVALDPGFGFSKSFEQNISLAAGFHRFKELGFPLLAGVSRKAFIGALTGVKDPARRMPGSVAAALRLAAAGADILRVHDVPETVQALKVFSALSPEWRMKSEE